MTDLENFKSNTNYVLWFHQVDNEKWNLESYTKIMTIGSYHDLLYCIKKINNVTAGMFFLMKENINPIWEDKNNKQGGFWTFKIAKADAYNLWTELLLNVCFNGITNNKESIITGVSLSPKINNCIFKIWNNNKNQNDISFLKSDLKYLDISEGLYRAHKK